MPRGVYKRTAKHKELLRQARAKANNAVVRSKISKSVSALWDDPDYRSKTVDAMKEHYSDTENRQKLLDRLRELTAEQESRRRAHISRFLKDHPQELQKRVAAMHTPEARKKAAEFKGKSSPEQYFETHFVIKYNLELDYTGDYSFCIGHMSPDFASPDRKFVVEIYGCYPHGCQKCYPGRVPYRSHVGVKIRTARFAKYGIQCVVLWEHELTENPQETLTKLQEVYHS